MSKNKALNSTWQTILGSDLDPTTPKRLVDNNGSVLVDVTWARILEQINPLDRLLTRARYSLHDIPNLYSAFTASSLCKSVFPQDDNDLHVFEVLPRSQIGQIHGMGLIRSDRCLPNDSQFLYWFVGILAALCEVRFEENKGIIKTEAAIKEELTACTLILAPEEWENDPDAQSVPRNARKMLCFRQDQWYFVSLAPGHFLEDRRASVK